MREEHFKVTLGESAALQPSEHFIRFFCAAGGTHLFGRDDLLAPPKVGSKVLSAMLGTLDAPAEVIPQIHRPTAFDQRLATASTTNKGNAAVEG